MTPVELADAVAEREVALESLDLYNEFQLYREWKGFSYGVLTTKFEMRLRSYDPQALASLVKDWPFPEYVIDLSPQFAVAQAHGPVQGTDCYLLMLRGQVVIPSTHSEEKAPNAEES